MRYQHTLNPCGTEDSQFCASAKQRRHRGDLVTRVRARASVHVCVCVCVCFRRLSPFLVAFGSEVVLPPLGGCLLALRDRAPLCPPGATVGRSCVRPSGDLGLKRRACVRARAS
eukprot:15462236-Alexandrium_andersonii.AAC.1